jgi:hypothetical protein
MKNLIHNAKKVLPSAGRIRTTGALVFAVGLVFASPGFLIQSPANAAPAGKPSQLTDSEVNRSLDHLARKLAAAVEGSDLRSTLHGAIKERFDGDTDALWSSLDKDSTLSRKVAGSRQGGDEIAREAARIPRLQVAVPVHFKSWDPATYAPLVAYFPEGVDDTTLKTITAYDSAGHAVQLDAQVAPAQPVIVLSLNERTDDAGNLLKQETTSSSQVDASQNSVTAATAAATYSVDMVIVHLIDDKEPWPKGDAEISMKAKSRGCSGTEYLDTNWANLNNSDDWWAPAGGRNLGLTTCDVVFYWWEDDGGSANFTLSYGGFSLGVSMDDDDDLIGGKQVPYASFQGGTMREDSWTALAQWTE